MPDADAPQALRGFDTVIFDCDSTLSTIEGIDELGRMKGRADEVAALTEAAMAGDVPLENVYGHRLAMLAPTADELATLAELYRTNMVNDAREVVRALIAAGRDVFIVSGGLLPAVLPFGEWLGVPGRNIHAVPSEEALVSPLARSDGKPLVIGEILQSRPGRSLLVGDGASDLAAYEIVDLFAGYTGVVGRPRVLEESDVLVTGDSLAPVLSLVLTMTEEEGFLNTEHARVVGEAQARIRAGELVVNRGDRP